MRARQAIALIWELWARNRLALMLIILGAPLCLWLADFLAQRAPELGPLLGILKLIPIWAVVFLVMLFSYADFSARRLETGYPQHVLRLPLPNWMLVGVPLVFAAVALFVFMVLLLWVAGAYTVSLWDYPVMLLGSFLCMSWMQMINWGLHRTPVRAALVLLAVIGAGGVGLLSLLSFSMAPLLPVAWALPGMVALAAVGIWLAWLSVVRTRCGSTLGKHIFWSDFHLPGFSMPNRAYRSADVAQFRYEWRVFGWIFPAATLFFGLLLFMANALPGNPQDVIEASSMAAGMFIYVASLLGIEIAKSHFGASDHPLTAFAATRPISTTRLAYAKLRVAGLSILIGTVICLAPLYPAWQVAGLDASVDIALSQLAASQGAFGAAIVIISMAVVVPTIAWIACGNILALSLTGRKALKVRIVAAILVLMALAILFGYRIVHSPQLRLMVFEHAAELGFLMAGIIAGFLVFLWRKLQAQSVAVVRRPLVVSAIATGVAIAAIASLDLGDGIATIAAVIVLNLGMLSALPWVGAPLALIGNRHR